MKDEQMELDLVAENNPTTIEQIIQKNIQRPNWHSSEVFPQILKLFRDIIMVKEETYDYYLEECTEDFKKFNYFKNDYEVSKWLVDVIGVDEEIIYNSRAEIENACSESTNILEREIKNWVKYWKIIPPYSLHEEVFYKKYSFSKNNEKAIITNIDLEKAVYTVFEIESQTNEEEIKNAKKTKKGYLVSFEDLFKMNDAKYEKN
ncbi:hypothetical protein M0P65_05335 [Candidatus Gracilibacteria bacterium]|nr:hypothetical protein [Candidatus Gracilibacteria bacterium]